MEENQNLLLIKQVLQKELEEIINETKLAFGEIKRIAVAQAWKILQLTTAKVIKIIEDNASTIKGKDKKDIAMEFLDKFYNNVFTIVDIPFVPSVFESIIHKYVKTFLMILVSATIDAMVTTFKELGIFKSKEVVV